MKFDTAQETTRQLGKATLHVGNLPDNGEIYMRVTDDKGKPVSRKRDSDTLCTSSHEGVAMAELLVKQANGGREPKLDDDIGTRRAIETTLAAHKAGHDVTPAALDGWRARHSAPTVATPAPSRAMGAQA